MFYKKTALMMGFMLASLSVWANDHYDAPITIQTNDTSKIMDIDEVVVVSQPKENLNLRHQPLSSSMFDAGYLQRIAMTDLRQLSAYTPSFLMPSYGSRYTSSIYIRGIGSRLNSPSVGIYSDGIPLISKSAYNFYTYDLGRADVLRGPQGTLYGINTEGGLIRMYSINPMTFQGTRVQLGVGSHFTRHAEVAHYTKPCDDLAFSIATFYNGQRGFFNNITTGQRADKSNEAGGKFRLVYAPTSDLKIDYIADYQYVRQNAFGYGLWQDGTQASASNRQSNYRRNMFNTGLLITKRMRALTFSSTTSFQYLKDYMLMDIDYMPTDYMQMEERQHQNALTHEMALKGRLRLSHSDALRAWQWSVGSFTSYQWNKTEAPVSFYEDMNHMLGNTIQTAMFNAMVQSMMARFEASGMSPEQARQQAEQTINWRGGVAVDVNLSTIPGSFHLPMFNQGIFHESSIDLTRRLTLTLGLRYDYSKVKIDYQTQAQMACNVNVMGTQATSHLRSVLAHTYKNGYHQLLPKLGLTYQLDNQGSNLYAAACKGYRAGGYNFQMFSDILQTELSQNSSQRGDYEITHSDDDYARIEKTISYAPETTWNYEVGAHLNLAGGMLQMDAAAYLTHIFNQQLSVMAGNYGFGRMMVNAGRSRSLGAELSLCGSHLDNHLTWTASYALTHSEFRDYKDDLTQNGATQTIDYRHHRVPFVPQHTLGATADYRFDCRSTHLRAITIGANVSVLGSVYWDEQNQHRQPMYALLGLHADATTSKITISLWGRNITNTHYNTFAIESAATGTKHIFAQQGTPLQMGVDVKLNF